MPKEKKDKVKEVDRLRKEGNKMKGRRMKEEGKRKQTNMETGEMKERRM